MPKNRIIYAGILVIAATALLWGANWILARVSWALPYVAVIGVVLIVAGVIIEGRAGKSALLPGEKVGEPLVPVSTPEPREENLPS